jgi:hypothetical protein
METSANYRSHHLVCALLQNSAHRWKVLRKSAVLESHEGTCWKCLRDTQKLRYGQGL